MVLSTDNYYLATPREMFEYECIQDGDKKTFEPTYVEQCSSILFRFVRKDGNKTELKEFMR